MLMFIPPMVYTVAIMTGTMISLSSSSLLGMWLGLELNIMAFIPLIINLENNKKSSEAAIKYFLIQAMASLIMIFAMTMFYFYSNSVLENLMSFILNISLLTKLGVAPFYMWFIEVLEGLGWLNSLILLTWQKISPLVMLSLFFNFGMVLTLSIFSALVGALLGLNQTSLRKILAFSSISHMGWVMGVMIFYSNFWMWYFFIYTLTSFILCLSFMHFNMNYFTQIVMDKSLNKKFIIFINLFSLGGLPPLLGFLPKLIAFSILKQSFPFLTMLILASLVTLYYYVRLCFSAFTLSYQSLIWKSKSDYLKKVYMMSLVSIISIIGLVPMSILII